MKTWSIRGLLAACCATLAPLSASAQSPCSCKIMRWTDTVCDIPPSYSGILTEYWICALPDRGWINGGCSGYPNDLCADNVCPNLPECFPPDCEPGDEKQCALGGMGTCGITTCGQNGRWGDCEPTAACDPPPPVGPKCKSVGNPVDIVTGTYEYTPHRADAEVVGGSTPLTLARTYSSHRAFLDHQREV